MHDKEKKKLDGRRGTSINFDSFYRFRGSTHSPEKNGEVTVS